MFRREAFCVLALFVGVGCGSADSSELSIVQGKLSLKLSSTQYELVVSKETGGIVQLRSLLPEPLNLCAEGPSAFFFGVQGTDWAGSFNRLNRNSISKSKEYVSLTCWLGSDEQRLSARASARVTYTLYNDHLAIKATVNYNVTEPYTCTIGIGQRCDTKAWQRQFYQMNYGDIRTYPVDQALLCNYQDSLDDALQPEDRLAQPWAKDKPGGYRADLALALPYSVLERNDRYWLWGCLDLGKFVVLGSRKPEVVGPERSTGALLPSFMVSPKGIKKGDSYSFDFFYKVFPKPQNDFTDVHGWYARNVYSTDSLSKGIVTLPKDMPHRTVTPGPMRLRNVWFCGEGPPKWDEEIWPTDGTWLSYTASVPVAVRSAASMKQELKERSDKGQNVYLYHRQLYMVAGLRRDTPVYERWMLRNKYGEFVYFAGNPELYTFTAEQKQRFGVSADKTGYVYADFCDDEFRNWYINNVKRAIQFYDPAGIAWDVGWGDLFTGACRNHPEHHGIQHGILRVQYEIYNWLKKNYSDKRVITNCHHGTPSALYSDGVMYEVWIPPEVTELEAQKSRVYRNVPICYGHGWEPEQLFTWTSMGVSAIARPPCTEDFIEFCAKTYSVPLVTERKAVEVTPEDEKITASVWADERNCLLAAYNAGDKEVRVKLTLDKQILGRYGQSLAAPFSFTLVAQDLSTKPAPGIEEISNHEFRCPVGAKQLLFGEVKPESHSTGDNMKAGG